jgi:hypothetical protein
LAVAVEQVGTILQLFQQAVVVLAVEVLEPDSLVAVMVDRQEQAQPAKAITVQVVDTLGIQAAAVEQVRQQHNQAMKLAMVV